MSDNHVTDFPAIPTKLIPQTQKSVGNFFFWGGGRGGGGGCTRTVSSTVLGTPPNAGDPGRLFGGLREGCLFSTERENKVGHSEASKRSRFPGCPLRGFQPSGSHPRATDKYGLRCAHCCFMFFQGCSLSHRCGRGTKYQDVQAQLLWMYFTNFLSFLFVFFIFVFFVVSCRCCCCFQQPFLGQVQGCNKTFVRPLYSSKM